MSLVTRLPFPPMPDESARGLVVRLAEDNLCSSPDMCEWLGIPQIDSDLVDPVPAAGVMGLDPDAFAAMGFADGGTEAFLGHRVPRLSSLRYAMRVCPACLAEAPYHRRIWDHHQLDTCPVHRLKLLDRCPACAVGGRIRWGRKALRSGECGHDLSVQPAEPAGDCVGAAVIYRHCGLACDGPDLPAPFVGLPLQCLLDVLFFLGRTDLVIAQGNPDGFAPRTMWAEGAILNAGARIALGWPMAFDDLAHRVKASYPEATGTMLQYGYLHRFIGRCGAAPYRDLLRSAYADHLSGCGNVPSKAWPNFLPARKQEASVVSILEARQVLGLGWKAFVALRSQPLWSDIKPAFSARSGTPLYNRNDVVALANRLQRMVSPQAGDRLLGTSLGKVAKLFEAGLLPVHSWSRNPKNGEHRSVDTADIDLLCGRILKLAVSRPPSKPISFQVLQAMATQRRSLPFPTFFRCLVSGQLRGYRIEGSQDNLGSLVFEKGDAASLLDRLASSTVSGKLILQQVIERLNLPGHAVHQLVSAKLLAEPVRRSAWLFDAASVAQFLDTFTYDVSLAKEKRVDAADIRKALALIGVNPVVLVDTRRGGKAAIYRMSDLGPTV